jgi:hypothetical protein
VFTSALSLTAPVTAPPPANPAERSSVRTLTIPTEQLPVRTSTESPEVFACGIPGVTCEPTVTAESTSTTPEPEPDDSSSTP